MTEVVVGGAETEVVVSGAIVSDVVGISGDVRVVAEGQDAETVVEFAAPSVAGEPSRAEVVIDVNQLETVVGVVPTTPPAAIDDDVTLAYDGDGRLSTVTRDDGRVLTLNYGADGLASVDRSDDAEPLATLSYTSGTLTRVVFGAD